MSVLSRHRTIPSPRTSEEAVIDLDAAPMRTSSHAPTSRPSRTAFLVSSAAIIAGAAVGATVYVLAQDDTPSPTTAVTFPVNSEAQRDAAAAARGGTTAPAANTEAQRDAAAAARGGTAAPAATTEAQRDAAAAARNASR